MVTIYKDYQDEPEDTFIPLPAELACQLYHLEMEKFTEDIAFYRKLLPQRGNILEMGSGTGRVSQMLASSNRNITGIDISLPMLHIAKNERAANCRFVCMDMISPGFRIRFDSILIPYNTLNLLSQEDQLRRCLGSCHTLLRNEGTLIAQIFIPAGKTLSRTKKTFQFQLFDRREGGKIVKEIIKEYNPETELMQVEERFRIRPMQAGKDNKDYSSSFSILAWPLEQWLSLFSKTGFYPESLYGNYTFTPYQNIQSTCLLILLKKQHFK